MRELVGKLIRDTSTPEKLEWWNSVLAAANRARKTGGSAEDARRSVLTCTMKTEVLSIE